jgi:hypothetical protein
MNNESQSPDDEPGNKGKKTRTGIVKGSQRKFVGTNANPDSQP